MRKIAFVLAVLMCLAIFSSCKKEEEPLQPTTKLVDGTYTVRWDQGSPNDYSEYITCSIANGVVTILDYDAKNAAGALKTQDTAIEDQIMLNAETIGAPGIPMDVAYAKIIESFNLAGGDVNQMETVVGATTSSKSFKILMSALLAGNAILGDTRDQVLPFYADGDYSITTAAPDEDGYTYNLKAAVSAGKISYTEFDAKNEAGEKRTASDEAFATLVQNVLGSYNESGSIPSEEDEATAKIAGLFQSMARKLANNAHVRGKSDLTYYRYQDGTYTAEMSKADAEGYKDYVILSVLNDQVTILEFDGKDADGNLRSENDGLREKMMEASVALGLSEIGPDEMGDSILAAFSASDANVLEMENVAGATISANNFKLMVGELLGFNAVHGIEQLLTVDPIE